MDLEIRECHAPEALTRLAPAWLGLAARAALTPFQTWQWHQAWWELVGDKSHDSLLILTFHHGDELLALAPLAESRQEEGRVLRFSTDPWADYHDILVADEEHRRAIHEKLFAYLVEGLKERRWDRIELRELAAQNALADFLAERLAAPTIPGLEATVVKEEVCPRLELNEETAYESAFMKREYAIKERRLARRGELTCLHHVHPRAIAERMPNFSTMHLRQWLGRPDCGLTFDRADMLRFYHGCVPLLASAGYLLLSELLLDGRPIGYYFGFLYRRVFWGYRTTFDTELAKFSPGGVMHRQLFRFLRQAGYEGFDFMRGEMSYKQRYANRIHHNRAFRARLEGK